MNEAIRNVINFTDNNIVLIDGRDFKPICYLENNIIKQVSVKCIEGGDNKYACIAAASILAKVTRDRIMRAKDSEFPDYGFSGNKGYPCPKHKNALKKIGPCSLHRTSWAFMDDTPFPRSPKPRKDPMQGMLFTDQNQ